MARSPSSERRPPVSRRATAPLLWPVGASATSLARVETEAGKEENGARVHGGAGRSAVLMCRESRVTVYRQPFGLDAARVGMSESVPYIGLSVFVSLLCVL
jgi:hypothetical protein